MPVAPGPAAARRARGATPRSRPAGSASSRARVEADEPGAGGGVEAERRLAESEERFRALVEHGSDFAFIVDDHRRMTFASPPVRDSLGWEPDELVGRAGAEFTHPDDAATVTEAMVRLRASPGTVERFVARVRAKDGRYRLLEFAIRNLLGVPAVRGFVVNCRDITDQRQLEERYLQAQKMESIGRLAGGVAHDFNNLLVGILGYAELLEQGIRQGRPSLDDLAEIRKAGERAKDLTRQLLTVARRQVVSARTLDVNDVLRESQGLLARLLGEDVLLRIAPASRPCMVRADPSQLQQVLLNLATNARDAMPRGGTLALEASIVGVDDAGETKDGGGAGRYVCLAVADTGDGMTDEVKAHLFEPFYTTKPAGRGTGLGLATVYGIVRQAGGHVTVRSERGAGTRFEIYLPATDEPPVKPAPPAPPAETRGHEAVLVVEDEASVRELVARTLSEAGYRVVVAGAGPLAVQAALAAPELDLLITDVVLPGLSGRDVAEAARGRHPALAVLYVSGYARETVTGHGIADRGPAFLAKPFTPSALLARVREVLERRPAPATGA